jgi:hypothetical protein
VKAKNIEDVSGYGDKISLQLMKNYIKQFTMKRDLYRFMKYRRELEQINEIGNRILKHQLKEKLKKEYEIQV